MVTDRPHGWLADAAGGVVAVEAGHPHVHQDDLGPEFVRRLHRLDAVVRRADFVAEELEHHGHRSGRVLGCRPPPGCAARSRRPGRPPGAGPRAAAREPLRRHREPDGEGAPLARPVALGRDRPAVHLDQALHQREPDPEPAGGPLDAPVHLGEHVEDARQGRGRDADPGVPDGHDDLALAPLGGEPDAAAPLGVLGAVGEQVARTPGPAGSGRRRGGPARSGARRVSSCPASSISGAGGLHGAADHVGEEHPGAGAAPSCCG